MSYTNTPVSSPTNSLDQPVYGASIGTAYGRFWKKYATFSGRASLSEYWWVSLIHLVISFVLSGIWFATAMVPAMTRAQTDPNAAMGALASPAYIILLLFGLATLVPGLAIAWRRLHDTGRSGGWYFIALVPVVGPIIAIVFLASASSPEGARFDRA